MRFEFIEGVDKVYKVVPTNYRSENVDQRSKSVYFFHATPAKNVPGILTEGFRSYTCYNFGFGKGV